MKDWLKTIAAFLLIGIVFVWGAYSIANSYIRSHWTFVYKAELDKFFGKDNWECVDQRTETSSVYKTSSGNSGKKRAMRYKRWDIQFTNAAGDEELWSITNLTLKINQRQRMIFGPERYSNKQALTLELMDIAEGLACEAVYRDMIWGEFPEKESECIGVRMLYKGGHPRPGFYSRLMKEDWFTVEGVSAEKFLAYEEHDFYIDILAYEYKMEKLTEAERQHIYDSIGILEQKLLDQYGENASFQIYFSQEYRVEYVDGIKQ